MIAVISFDGTIDARAFFFASQVDAWKVAKPIGATIWRCTPNNDVCERVTDLQ